jgi:hypothetical protein
MIPARAGTVDTLEPAGMVASPVMAALCMEPEPVNSRVSSNDISSTSIGSYLGKCCSCRLSQFLKERQKLPIDEDSNIFNLLGNREPAKQS